MSRFILLVAFAFGLFAVPSFATEQHAQGVLPDVIATAINDAAGTGNPLVVMAVTEQMGRTFPSLKIEIDQYAEQVAKPATTIMASIMEMNTEVAPIDNSFAMLFDEPMISSFDSEEHTHANTDEAETAALAADLNNMDIGDSIAQ